jgi:hypothetical protein
MIYLEMTETERKFIITIFKWLVDTHLHLSIAKVNTEIRRITMD